MKHFKIRSKVVTMVLGVSILSLSLFLIATQYTIKKEEKNSAQSINVLKNEA